MCLLRAGGQFWEHSSRSSRKRIGQGTDHQQRVRAGHPGSGQPPRPASAASQPRPPRAGLVGHMIRAGPAPRAAAVGPGLRAGGWPLEGKGDGPDGWGPGDGLARGRGPHAARCLCWLRCWKTPHLPTSFHLQPWVSGRGPAPSPRRTGGPRAGSEARGREAPVPPSSRTRNTDAGLRLCHGVTAQPLSSWVSAVRRPGPRVRTGFLLGAEGCSRVWRIHSFPLHPWGHRAASTSPRLWTRLQSPL